MSVTSLLFIAFSACAALIYRVLPSRLRNFWLLAVSIAFLSTWSWKFVFVLALFGAFNYLAGIKIETSPKRGHWLTAGIILNIFFLLILKYNQFYLPAFQRLLIKLDVLPSQDTLSLLVPVGLSFLVVQAISYLLDVSNKRSKPELSWVKFGVYILYFPKLLSGPVERARGFLPKLDAPLPFDRKLLERSLSLLLAGLFRKLAIADILFSMIPADAFLHPQEYAGQHLVFWLLAYAFAIYNDFAGYTGIIRGVSLWFGIDLTNNFNLPYLSRSFTEFWNRWHISLSNWLRDYIFFPLQRRLMKRFPQRNHVLNLVLPPLATLFVSGLWHGLAWNLVVWGLLHGTYLVVERVSGVIKPQPAPDEQPRWRQLLGIGITFILAVLAWIPFKMSLPVAAAFFTGMFKWVRPDLFLLKRYLTGSAEVLSWSPLNLPNPLLLAVIAIAIAFDLLSCRKGSEVELTTQPRWLQIVILIAVILVLLFSVFMDTSAPFVYQGF